MLITIPLKCTEIWAISPFLQVYIYPIVLRLLLNAHWVDPALFLLAPGLENVLGNDCVNKVPLPPSSIEIHGKVLDDTGNPTAGTSVVLTGDVSSVTARVGVTSDQGQPGPIILWNINGKGTITCLLTTRPFFKPIT